MSEGSVLMSAQPFYQVHSTLPSQTLKHELNARLYRGKTVTNAVKTNISEGLGIKQLF